jgi:leader peptidase (prepilin peptidase)/N-methyltransferase
LGGVFTAAIDRYFFEGSILTPVSFANFFLSPLMQNFWLERFLFILLSAGLILLIRFVYWLIRRREGLGLGDAKLMAMLGAWLGLAGALLAFGIGIVLAAAVALIMLANRPKSESASSGAPNWAAQKLPLGTFLCIGGIVSLLWGDQIVGAYLHWAGF